ncbi:MAG TPA: hypothetical protein DCY24_05685, partial [Rikenellaceae bacterium]|nr:hypothetical protein [Rikenellaceae bacterium]
MVKQGGFIPNLLALTMTSFKYNFVVLKTENLKVFEVNIKSLIIFATAAALSVNAFAQANGSGNGAVRSYANGTANDRTVSQSRTKSTSSEQSATKNRAGSITGTVIDHADGSPVAGAAVAIKGDKAVWDVTDSLGRFKLNAAGGTLQITCMGYKTLTTAVRKDGRYSLIQDSFAINEVVVTATESHGLTSSSRIGQDAIAHIQPSSFADLLELLPGGRSVDPSFSTPKTIDLRAVSVSSGNYNTSSLGTRFLIDGVPVNNDANLQTTPAFSNYGSSFVNAGVDMRTITTEDVESIEIIRGIPSVEYGDLTSG